MARSSTRPAPHSAATTTWVKKEMHHLHLSKTRWCLQFLPPSSRYQSWKLSLSFSLSGAKETGARIHELLTCFRDGYYFVSFWALDSYLLKKNAEAHHSLPLGWWWCVGSWSYCRALQTILWNSRMKKKKDMAFWAPCQQSGITQALVGHSFWAPWVGQQPSFPPSSSSLAFGSSEK